MRSRYYPYYHWPYHRHHYYSPYFYDYYWPHYRPIYDDNYYLYDSNYADVDQDLTNFGDMYDVYQESYINQVG